VYTNAAGHLVYNINGTQMLSDIGTGALVLAGQAKQSGRFAKEKNKLELARKKHNPTSVSVSGHSLGAALANTIATVGDKVTTADGLYTSSHVGNNRHYRATGDPISINTIGSKHTTNHYVRPKLSTAIIGGPIGLAREQHNISHLKGKKIIV
jgi:hypothetical protein